MFNRSASGLERKANPYNQSLNGGIVMRKAVAISFLGAIFLFASGHAYSQKIETIDGVRVVHNEKGGKWGNTPGNLFLLDRLRGVKYNQYKIIGDLGRGL